jgi:hypothetical protein
MERLTLKMQQESHVHWRYEWPIKRKVKWHVDKLFSRREPQVLKRWLGHIEDLSETNKKNFICKPEVREDFNEEEERSSGDLINFQEGKGVITLNCTTHAYLASGLLMPLHSQSHAEQLL